MSNPSTRTAIVIGGGISGLATAIALRRVGIEARVFERAPAIQEVGAGLSLWSNAVVALARLGLDQPVIAAGSVLERALNMTTSGKVLSDDSLGQIAAKVGAPTICVHRAELQKTLVGALEPSAFRTSAACVGYVDDPEGVTARFADGSEARADFLVGADGLQSAVREQLHGKSVPRYAGYFAWRGIAALSSIGETAGTGIFALGQGIQFGILPCGPGRYYWFATKNAPPNSSDQLGGRKRQVLETVAGWPPLFSTVVNATDEDAILKNDIQDRPPTAEWGRGRVTFVGDAIHPTTPNLGQGACQALEDAIAIAHSLAHSADVVTGLRFYETQRRAWTAMVTRRSWSLGKLFQLENRLAAGLRDLMLQTHFSQKQAESLLTDLLNHEVPSLTTP